MTDSLITYRILLLQTPEIGTEFLWELAGIFASLALIYLMVVFFLKNKLSTKSVKTGDKKKELAPMISHFLFFNEAISADDKEQYLAMKIQLREMLKEPFDRKVLVEVLLDLQKDLSGEAREKIYDLYQNLGLHKDAFEKLNSRRWEVVSQGILELTLMQVVEGYGFIKRFINHRRGVVRKQAQIATVSLNREGIGYFLDTNRYRISEWQQLKLMEVLANFEDFDPPRFKLWLTSGNRDVVLFSLRLIRYYNQNDAIPAIIELLKHRNPHIKLEAISCIKAFVATTALPALKRVFPTTKTEIKIAILDAIASLGGESDLSFLEQVASKEQSFLVRNKAEGSMNAIRPGSILPSKDIEEPAEIMPDGNPDTENIIPTETGKRETELEQISFETIHQTPVKSNQLQKKEIWELPAELEDEDEDIFEQCLWEELEDILEESDRDMEEKEILPLDFLPIVERAEKPTVSHKRETEETTIKNQNTMAPNNPEEQSFRNELDRLLRKIAFSAGDEHIEDEISMDFIPYVTESTEDESGMPDNTGELPVEWEEVVLSPSELSSDTPEQDPLEFSGDINWDQWFQEVPANEQRKPDTEKDQDLGEDLIGFSIFQELFRTYDTESKLILLDELPDVGEQKELYLLESLFDDEDLKVRKKARAIHKCLKERLQRENPETEADVLSEEIAPEEVIAEMEIETQKAGDDNSAETEKKLKPLELCFWEGDDEEVEDLLSFELDESPARDDLEGGQEGPEHGIKGLKASISSLRDIFMGK